MYVLSSYKHNRFQKVDIPRNSELVRAFGLTRPGSQYSGDEFVKPNASKIDQVAQVEKEAFEPEK